MIELALELASTLGPKQPWLTSYADKKTFECRLTNSESAIKVILDTLL